MNYIRFLVLLCTVPVILFSCSGEDETALFSQPDFIQDIRYASNIDTSGYAVDLTLDIYYPAAALKGKKYPTILLFHGGSYLYGSKGALNGLCIDFADSGFIAVSVDYRLGWKDMGYHASDPFEMEKASYRAIQDANAALRFLVHNAGQLSIDTSRIFIGGYSAGGCIAMNSSYLDDAYILKHNPSLYNLLGGLKKSGNDLTDTYTIKGIMNLSGSIMDSSLITRSNAIPAICFHGMQDLFVPEDSGLFLGYDDFPKSYGSLSIYRSLIETTAPAVAVLLPSAAHVPLSIFTNQYVSANTSCFFKSLINKKPYSGLYFEAVGTCR